MTVVFTVITGYSQQQTDTGFTEPCFCFTINAAHKNVSRYSIMVYYFQIADISHGFIILRIYCDSISSNRKWSVMHAIAARAFLSFALIAILIDLFCGCVWSQFGKLKFCLLSIKAIFLKKKVFVGLKLLTADCHWCQCCIRLSFIIRVTL